MRFYSGTSSDLEQRVRETFEGNEVLQLQELHVEPAKFLHGRFYFADGTDWDPGSGRGVYMYDSSGPTWRFLG